MYSHCLQLVVLVKSRASPQLQTPAAAAASGCGSLAASIPGTKVSQDLSAEASPLLSCLLPPLFIPGDESTVRPKPGDLLPVIIRQIAGGKRGARRIILSAAWSRIGWLLVTAPWRWNLPVQSLSWPCIMDEAQLLLPLALRTNNFTHQPLGRCSSHPHHLHLSLLGSSWRKKASLLRTNF